MKTYLKSLAVCVLGCLAAAAVKADLLGVNPGYPQINFVNTDSGSVTYDPGTGILTVNSLPYDFVSSANNSGSLIVSNRSIQIQLNTDGQIVSGTSGFIVTGQFAQVQGGVTNQYSGTLLQGDVTAFGYLPAAGGVAQFDFRVQLTGGQLLSQFDCGDDLAVTMTSESSTFTGSFTNSFSGAAKGYCGPEDMTPPMVTCPPLASVVTTPATDPNNPTNQGFIITYPDPVVTDNCDPNPTIFCDTPSGSFVALNPGDGLTITCYGIDASGNYNSCSFTVIMGMSTPPPCPLGFTDSGCEPVTLPTDAGTCAATYAVPLPTATNCSGQIFVAAASALSESGSLIVLTNLGNGMVQGEFPRTTTTNGNIIIFTAQDGQGNQVIRQCQVFVQDQQPPAILCADQTATFKPILTNVPSCSEADFDNARIAASNYLWFNSVIRSTALPRNCNSFTVHVFNQTIQLAVDNTNITLAVPDAYVVFSNGVAAATTAFTNGQWITYSSGGCRGNTFASGLAWQVPFDLDNLMGNCWGRDRDSGCFRRHVNSATWYATFAVDTPGVALSWQWGAVVESSLATNCSTLGVKPVDDNSSSCWKNPDPAGTCENFKSRLIAGGRGKGWIWNGREKTPDCTGILSDGRRCNLGKGIVCEGPVDFKTPLAVDNCDKFVQVTCAPPSGSVFGPGNYPITCTAVDSSGNSNQCTFTLTVLAPLQVVFDYPIDDNIADNIAEPDAGFTDMNCPDDPSTTEYVTCFKPGDVICHKVRLLDCSGNDVTAALSSCVTVHIDVTERQGNYANSVLVNDLTPNSGSAANPGNLMIPCRGQFIYNLNTAGYPGGTVNSSLFFRCCVWVDYNSSPGIPVGMEDVILQSQ